MPTEFRQTLETTSITNTVRLSLPDGRMLAYAEYGDREGAPVIAFHGMPGSRLMMKVADKAAREAGIRIIAPDRPGYGLSDPYPHGTLLRYTRDIADLADALSLQHFAVMGVSGGGPYALACAYQLSTRLSMTAVVSGIAQLRLPAGMRGMILQNRIMLSLGRLSPTLAGLVLPALVRSALPSMEKHVRNGTSPDPNISADQFAVMVADQREASRVGRHGVAFDMKNLWRPLGFRLEDVRGRVYLWHGEADNLAPVMLAHYVANHVPDCRAIFYPGEGHTDPLTKHIGEILATVVAVRDQ